MKFFVFLFFFITLKFSWAASCCGGGGGSQSVMGGDRRAQISWGVSYLTSSKQSDVYGLVETLTDAETQWTHTFSASYLLSDRWQAGLSLSIRDRYREDVFYRGFGNPRVFMAYELMPDWDYHPWRPLVVWGVGVTPSLVTSRFDGGVPFLLDAMGTGFWEVDTSLMLQKSWGRWLAHVSVNGKQGFSKKFEGVNHVPGFRFESSTGLNYGWKRLTVGVTVSLAHQQGVKVAERSRAPRQLLWQLGTSIGYQITESFGLALAYRDDEILKESQNIILGRGVTMTATLGWDR